MKRIVFIFAGIILAACFSSCVSAAPVEVPAEASAMEIIQMAQTAYDKGKSNAAIEYYGILLQRYGMDIRVYIEARYEIAHIYFKKKDYENARGLLEEILNIYNESAPGVLPAAFRRLAENDLENIPKVPVTE